MRSRGAAAIDLELGFAGAAATDAAGQAAHTGVLVVEPGQVVAQLGEFDLKLAVAALRVLGENVEDELGAVEDPEFTGIGDGSQLARLKVLAEDD